MADLVATRDSWQTLPFGAMAPLPYHASFARDEYAVLCRGLIPEEMEDKWFVFMEADSLFFHRSWTGLGIYRVDFRPADDRVEVSGAFVATDGQYKRAADAEEVARLDFLIRAFLLRQPVEYPSPPG